MAQESQESQDDGVQVVDGERWLCAAAVAREMGVSTRRAYELCSNPAVRARKIGRVRYVHEASLREHMGGDSPDASEALADLRARVERLEEQAATRENLEDLRSECLPPIEARLTALETATAAGPANQDAEDEPEAAAPEDDDTETEGEQDDTEQDDGAHGALLAEIARLQREHAAAVAEVMRARDELAAANERHSLHPALRDLAARIAPQGTEPRSQWVDRVVDTIIEEAAAEPLELHFYGPRPTLWEAAWHDLEPFEELKTTDAAPVEQFVARLAPHAYEPRGQWLARVEDLLEEDERAPLERALYGVAEDRATAAGNDDADSDEPLPRAG